MPTTTLTPRRARKILQLAAELVRITTPLADDAMRRLMGNDHGFRWWRPADSNDVEAHRDWWRLVSYSDLCDEITREVERMKTPVKDRETIPWMYPREIPVIKLVLSEWRKLRKDRAMVKDWESFAYDQDCPDLVLENQLPKVAVSMEGLYALENRIHNESWHEQGPRNRNAPSGKRPGRVEKKGEGARKKVRAP